MYITGCIEVWRCALTEKEGTRDKKKDKRNKGEGISKK